MDHRHLSRWNTFLGLPPVEYEHAAVVVLPIPYEATATFGRGTALGPAAIIAASCEVETYDVRLRLDLSGCAIHTLPALEPDARSPEHMVSRVQEVSAGVMADGKFLLSLGGEHTVTVGTVRAAAARWGDIGVVQIDAHADLRDEYEGGRYHHATVMRRCLEQAKVVGVGVRSYSVEEDKFLKASGATIITPWAMRADRSVVERALASMPERVYVTIDVDGLDPSVVPGVGTPEPGGLSYDEALDVLGSVARLRTVVAADVVECAPTVGDRVSAFASARLACAAIALFARR